MALAQGIHVPFVAGAIPKLLDQGFGIQDAVKWKQASTLTNP